MPRNAIDMTGERYGLLEVIERAGSNKNNKPLWRCKCDCGNETILSRSTLIHGQKSCGCMQGMRKDVITPLIMRHTHKNRLYNIWAGMIERCYSSNRDNYKYYGARGITVCDEWRDNFDAFALWAINNGYCENLEIDRIDTNNNYKPSNCRWITHIENSWTRGIKSTNESGTTGVFWTPSRSGTGGKWRATITIDGKTKHLGYFDSLEEAKATREKAETERVI